MSDETTSHGYKPRPAARRATDEKINTAVLRLLSEEGPDKVTISAVSQASGVAKTTLYRRYTNSLEMLMDVISHALPDLTDIPETISYPSFLNILREFTAHLSSGVGGYYVFGQLLTSRDEFLLSWKELVLETPLKFFRTYYQHGVDQGVFRSDVHPEMLLQFVLGGAVANDVFKTVSHEEWLNYAAEFLWSSLTK